MPVQPIQPDKKSEINIIFRPLIILILVVGAAAYVYLAANLKASNDSTPIMPLDDTYIHFQYARVLAEGHPMRYNPNQPPTSGATSLIYPALLAIGYKLGFVEEPLAWWALAIGVICWVASAWRVYRLVSLNIQSRWIGLGIAAAFALNGSLSWAFMSGMETGLMVFATLLTLWYAVREDRRGVALAGSLAALVRPEGLAVALLAAIYVASREPSRRDLLRHLPIYGLPLIAGLIQPAINIIMTGAATASGLVAKSHLYTVPPDAGTILNSILATAGRTIAELFTGVSQDDGLYFVFVLSWLAIIAVILGSHAAWKSRRLTPELLVFSWIAALIATVSLLETAFWQFKRYQQPMIALLYPLAGWALIRLNAYLKRPTPRRLAIGGLLAILIGGSLVTLQTFVTYYGDNVREVASSQLPMARYVAAYVPPDAVVGVHDIGVMRYLGDHTTYDVIGLTTAGAARAWRNGPGAVYELMLHGNSAWRPAYFAIYRDAVSLKYLADTDLYKDTLASFPSTSPPRNIASATSSGQAVYKADWSLAALAGQPLQPSSLAAAAGMKLTDSVNVADLDSEAAHAYRWWEAAKRPGFATELRELDYIACQSPNPSNPTCRLMDGGRLISGGEEMTIATTAGQDLIWVTRVHPYNTVSLGIFVNGKRIATRLVPAVQGQWLEIASYIPGAEITGTQTRVRVEANLTDPAAGHYMPYYHWFYQGTYPPEKSPSAKIATFGRSIILSEATWIYNAETHRVKVGVTWTRSDAAELDAQAGDAKIFVHVYAPNGQDKPPVAQANDQRLGQGTLPPQNWLLGIIHDDYEITLPAGIAPGRYSVALGLYDPTTGNRLSITGGDKDSRLFIGTIDVP
ncbi:MAG: hypothetical protein ABI947_06895 [Chloroflexota bacterium]